VCIKVGIDHHTFMKVPVQEVRSFEILIEFMLLLLTSHPGGGNDMPCLRIISCWGHVIKLFVPLPSLCIGHL